ncbi:MAG: hypothetical protein QNJ49_12000 [Mastigocoleus sp. MO_167.B18]|nr:hypothetical protein [Mastigocoleus sp. MO_167.B18]
MQVNSINWSETEKEVAHQAFDKAYEREINALLEEVRSQASNITEIDQIWRLHDFLSARRHDIDGKYDYRYSVLIFVFARLLKEKWLDMSDLEGLERAKLSKIAALTRM